MGSVLKGNSILNKAKHSENTDEWYTDYAVIEKEVDQYKEHFNNKIVLCNSDDPFKSSFAKYFMKNFNKLKLKKLICTSYKDSNIHKEISFNMLRYTFKVVTQISTSRELNRVSPNNIAEQSTRYVYEDGTLCCPHWININMISMNSINQIQAVYNNDGSYNKAAEYYLIKCQDKFDAYKYLINHFNVHRQDARGLLPIDTATVCAYTYSIDEWRAIIDLRYYGTTGKPHENAKIIAGMIKNELEQLGYDFAKENT